MKLIFKKENEIFYYLKLNLYLCNLITKRKYEDYELYLHESDSFIRRQKNNNLDKKTKKLQL